MTRKHAVTLTGIVLLAVSFAGVRLAHVGKARAQHTTPFTLVLSDIVLKDKKHGTTTGSPSQVFYARRSDGVCAAGTIRWIEGKKSYMRAILDLQHDVESPYDEVVLDAVSTTPATRLTAGAFRDGNQQTMAAWTNQLGFTQVSANEQVAGFRTLKYERLKKVVRQKNLWVSSGSGSLPSE